MKTNIIPYNPKLKEIARTLRKNSTLGEILLWKRLRNKQMLGYDFHRQKPIDEFVVDFYCVNFLRFKESDVRNNIRGVLDIIQAWIREYTK